MKKINNNSGGDVGGGGGGGTGGGVNIQASYDEGGLLRLLVQVCPRRAATLAQICDYSPGSHQWKDFWNHVI